MPSLASARKQCKETLPQFEIMDTLDIEVEIRYLNFMDSKLVPTVGKIRAIMGSAHNLDAVACLVAQYNSQFKMWPQIRF